MSQNEQIISAYLQRQGVHYYINNTHIVAHCVFNGCDEDSRGGEAHLYIELTKGLYHCKKCDARGNWVTFLKHFNDSLKDYPLDGYTLHKERGGSQSRGGSRSNRSYATEGSHRSYQISESFGSLISLSESSHQSSVFMQPHLPNSSLGSTSGLNPHTDTLCMNISQRDTPSSQASSLHIPSSNTSSLSPKKTKAPPIKESEVKRYTKKIPDEVRIWLHQRGLSDEVITQRELGYASFYGSNWITLPVRNEANELLFFKLRRDPSDTSGNRYAYYPKGFASIYGISSLSSLSERSSSLLPPKSICICEGEFDQMLLDSKGIPTITSTSGATTFPDEWIEKFSDIENIYFCFDNDKVGVKSSLKLQERFSLRFPEKSLFHIALPPEMGKDVTEFMQSGGIIEDILTHYSERRVGGYVTNFGEIRGEDIIHLLDPMIKYDEMNKLIVFLAMVTAFSEDSQMNIMMNAQSSSGKSFIPLEIAKLFPPESVEDFHYVSPNAFFHDFAEYDEELDMKVIKLDRKILIFVDQPHPELLQRLRPLLSHDKKILTSKIVDKNKSGGNQTKTISIQGYPTVIFCTANTLMDTQESTRFILLSPEIRQEKLRASIEFRIAKETRGSPSESREEDRTENTEEGREGNDGVTLENPDGSSSHSSLSDVGTNIHPPSAHQESQKHSYANLNYLRDHLLALRQAHIQKVHITNTERVKELFFSHIRNAHIQVRHQRDISRFLSFIKAFALLNFHKREREGNNIYTDERDIDEAYKIWKTIFREQEYGISPYIMNLFQEVYLPAFLDLNSFENIEKGKITGVERKSILSKHFEVYGMTLAESKWRQTIEPALENAGLLRQDKDGRNMILFPSEEVLVSMLTK